MLHTIHHHFSSCCRRRPADTHTTPCPRASAFCAPPAKFLYKGEWEDGKTRRLRRKFYQIAGKLRYFPRIKAFAKWKDVTFDPDQYASDILDKQHRSNRNSFLFFLIDQIFADPDRYHDTGKQRQEIKAQSQSKRITSREIAWRSRPGS